MNFLVGKWKFSRNESIIFMKIQKVLSEMFSSVDSILLLDLRFPFYFPPSWVFHFTSSLSARKLFQLVRFTFVVSSLLIKIMKIASGCAALEFEKRWNLTDSHELLKQKHFCLPDETKKGKQNSDCKLKTENWKQNILHSKQWKLRKKFLLAKSTKNIWKWLKGENEKSVSELV